MDKVATPSGKGATSNKPEKYIKKSPVKLDKRIAQILLNSLPETANQARRLVKYLSFNPDSPTNRLNKGSGVNLSDVARKYNHYLRPHGFYIDCRKPAVPIRNGYGEDSSQHLWGFYPVKYKALASD